MNRLLQKNSQTQCITKVIHELNQPLTVIKAYLGGCELRLQRNNTSPEELITTFQKINVQLDLLRDKIDSLPEHSISTIKKEEPLHIEEIISEIISLYSYEIEYYRIRLILNFQEKLSFFHLSSYQIKHILFRLIQLCIHTVKKNKVPTAEIEIQTYMDETLGKIRIKSNFLSQGDDLKKELTYCQTFLNQKTDHLLAESFGNNMDFQFIVFTRGNGYA